MIQGGLGSLIAESLSSMDISVPLFIKGLDSFVGSGKPSELEERYSLDPMSITKFVIDRINKL
jgi:transketolase C-terminal domain/subunit